MEQSKTKEAPADPMFAEPQQEHEWLQQLVGDWTWEGEAHGPDGEDPHQSQGTEHVRSLGGLWVLAEGEGTMPDGGPATMLMTLGYDPGEGRYLGSWVGSMMTHMFVYDGWMEDDGRTLTLEAEGPSMTGEGTDRYRDVIEIQDEDHRVLRSLVLTDDGEWMQFMEARYSRS